MIEISGPGNLLLSLVGLRFAVGDISVLLVGPTHKRFERPQFDCNVIHNDVVRLAKCRALFEDDREPQ